MKPFVILAAGRSGTQYVARLLAAMGVRIKHENVFLPGKMKGQTRETLAGLYEEAGVDGDVSWFAIPYMDAIPTDWRIVHLVRNPIRVIRSWVARGLWPLGVKNKTVKLVVDTLGWEEKQLSDPLACSIQYWYGWNSLIADFCSRRRSSMLVRLEDLSCNPVSIARLLGYLRYPLPDDIHARHESVPRDIGASKYMKRIRSYRYSQPLDPNVCWKNLFKSEQAKILPLARDLEYTIRELEQA